MEKTVDCKGMACPLPVVNAQKAARELQPGDVLTVLVDNEIAVQNLRRLAEHLQCSHRAEKRGDREHAVIMVIQGTQLPEESASCTPDQREKGLLVVLSSDTMGSGDPVLGASLMKAFIFALTRQDRLPETVLCYNSGARLTCQGADTLEDLKSLEAEGVCILTCGTCLDFYGLKEKLAVGSVTNMYEIVQRLSAARVTVRP